MKRTCFVAMQRQRRKVLNGHYAEERSAPDGSRKGTATRGAVETGTRLLEAVVTRNNTVSSIFLGYCLQSRHSDKLEARWPSFTSQNREMGCMQQHIDGICRTKDKARRD